MKNRLKFLAAACVVAFAGSSLAGPVSGQGTWESTLLGRDINGIAVDASSSSAVFLYDTTLRITWLRDANAGAGSVYDSTVDGTTATDGRMIWANAVDWATNLNVNGVTGWRLPFTVAGSGCIWSDSGGTDCGSNVRTKSGNLTSYEPGQTVYNEMAHLFYVTLGNVAYYAPGTGVGPQPGWDVINSGSFQNLQSGAGAEAYYWFSTTYLPSPTTAMSFNYHAGTTGTFGKGGELRAMAVRDGDVLKVPVGSLTFQGVTFTTKLVGKVFDVEIDAAGRNGDWADAMYIDSIQLDNIGTYSTFTMGGSGAAWTLSKTDLKHSGCHGGGKKATGACAQGTPISLTDDMHFTFTFDAGAILDDTAPYLTVRFLNAKMKNKGSMLAQPVLKPAN